jgi:anti-sigma-K factor RskA
MTEPRIDELRQRMIAALYGELPPGERREFEAALAADESLRREWEELQGARAFLAAAPIEDEVPQFVFLDPELAAGRAAGAASARARAGRSSGRLGWGWLAPWRSPAGGFALAGAAVIVLLLFGLRVDRTPAGLVVRFSTPAPETIALLNPNSPGVRLEPNGGGQGRSTEGDLNVAGLTGAAGGASVVSGVQGADGVSGSGATDIAGQPPTVYLTRAEFAAYANQLADALESGLSDYQFRGRGETTLLLRQLYDELSHERERDRDAINARIDELWARLVDAAARGEIGVVPPAGATPAPAPGDASDDARGGAPGNEQNP